MIHAIIVSRVLLLLHVPVSVDGWAITVVQVSIKQNHN